MHIVALIVALIVAASLWGSDQRVWAVVAFLVIASGVWLWPLRWLGTLMGAALAPPSHRRDAREFRAAAKKTGVWEPLSAEELRLVFRAWLAARSSSGVSADYYLTWLPAPDAAKLSRTVTMSDGVRVVFTKAGEHLTWKFEGLADAPHFLLHSLAQEKLTEEQLAAGETPWFPDVANRLASNGNSSDARSQDELPD